jgi:hypothetical protein
VTHPTPIQLPPVARSDGADQGIDLFARRAAAVPAELRRTLAIPLPELPEAASWTITGAGGSEGPARVLCALLDAAVHTRFVPLSCFVGGAAASGDVLVVASQGLCPNARLALAAQTRFRQSLLLSSLEPAAADDDDRRRDAQRFVDAGGLLVRHGPGLEPELLVRVVGPAAATLVAMRIAAAVVPGSHDLGGLDAVPAAAERAADAGRRAAERLPSGVPDTIALVTAGAYPELAHGLRWKLLETLGAGDPPVWDVLQLAHGPFQQFYERPLALFALESPSSTDRALFDRLERMLVPGRHVLVRLRATLPAPLSFFEHDAQLNAIALSLLRRRPRNLRDWPGKGKDGLLYGLGP